jgi:geranylgeranyl pyrophosphate synthase
MLVKSWKQKVGTVDENLILNVLSNKKQVIDAEILNFLEKRRNFKLFPSMKIFLTTGGKRLRPIMLILSAQSVGGKQSDVLQLALAIELIHNASLIIDDVIDDDEERRGIQSLHKKWNRNDAIIVASALSALAINLATKYGSEVTKFISETAFQLCEGEYLDSSSSLEELTEDEFISIIKKKTSSLFKASSYLGALVGGGNSDEVKSLTAYGENFGVAYQLKDDLSDLKTHRGAVPKDVLNMRPTLPLIHFIHHCHDRGVFNELKVRALSNNLTFDEYKNFLNLLEEEGSLRYCEQRIEYFANEAINSLSSLRNSTYKKYLTLLVQCLPTLI